MDDAMCPAKSGAASTRAMAPRTTIMLGGGSSGQGLLDVALSSTAGGITVSVRTPEGIGPVTTRRGSGAVATCRAPDSIGGTGRPTAVASPRPTSLARPVTTACRTATCGTGIAPPAPSLAFRSSGIARTTYAPATPTVGSSGGLGSTTLR